MVEKAENEGALPMKTLETYFTENVNLPDTAADAQALTEPERAFLEKYVGADWEGSEAAKALARPVQAETVMGPAQGADGRSGTLSAQEDIEAGLMAEEELRLVSFYVADQIFAVPIMLVQEVLRAVPSIKLPAAPPHLSGVTNLRGRVTPLVDLGLLLEVHDDDDQTDKFLIVCRMGQMQLGLAVRAIDTMYKAPRGDIEWNIESQVGIAPGLMAGLLKADEKLIQILSVSRLFQKVLKS